MGKLEETKTQLQAATSIEELEDIYAPHKSKRRTRAQAAEELGLQPLAKLIDTGGNDESPNAAAHKLVAKLAAESPSTEQISVDDALAGRAWRGWQLVRGEKEKVLTVRFECNPQAESAVVDAEVPETTRAPWMAELRQAVEDGLRRLLRPTIEREWRRMLKDCSSTRQFQ
eukprot:4636514-Amphidinium_carterae.1